MENGKETKTVEFDENPYAIETKNPEDIVRIFYINNLPIIPVISKRGLLLGILKKSDLISELSDIKRGELKIDKIVTRLAKKLSLDELLQYGHIKEFVVVNIFGEIQGKWSRIQLFTAAESHTLTDKPVNSKDIDEHVEEQVLDWMIYLILEHIPRALYALNSSGKTIFYNSYFEDFYLDKFDSEVDSEFVEMTFADLDKNEPVFTSSGQSTFSNTDFEIIYEKVPLMSKGEKVGFLLYFPEDSSETVENIITVQAEDLKMSDIVETVERKVLVDALGKSSDLDLISDNLGLSKQALNNKISKYNIENK